MVGSSSNSRVNRVIRLAITHCERGEGGYTVGSPSPRLASLSPILLANSEEAEEGEGGRKEKDEEDEEWWAKWAKKGERSGAKECGDWEDALLKIRSSDSIY